MASSSSSSSSPPCNKSFCSNYMLLKPEEAGFLELCKILVSSNVGKRKFVDCPDGTRETFGRRWILFVSVFVLKCLQAVAVPLAGLGSRVELWLNLLSENRGFFRLILNFFRGTVVHPNKTSANFASFIGHLDKRVELDKRSTNISTADDKRRYYAGLSVMAAKVSYENKNYIESVVKDRWKMDFLGFYDFWNDYQEKATTQVFLLDDRNDTIVIAFRGTEPFDADAWSTDFDISWYDLPRAGKLHGGFMKALGLQKSQGWPQQQSPDKPETAYYAVRKLMKDHLRRNDRARFVIAGHSLGGALAVLFPAILGLHEESELLGRIEGIYTYGQPRVGDRGFGEFMKEGVIEKYGVEYFRVVYSYDLVPRIPYDDSTLMFNHFWSCIYYNSFYQGRVVEEEPDKNYFSIVWTVPKLINAWWELIRSFGIYYTKGGEYEEGGLLRICRLIGLLVAGIPAHCPQDYVNAIKLGSPNLFLSLNSNKIRKLQ